MGRKNEIVKLKYNKEDLRYLDDSYEELKEYVYEIEEEETPYSSYSIGDIVYVKSYSYKNGDKGQKHLFVIVDQDNVAVPIEYLCMILSSKIEKIKYKSNILLKKDKYNNLNVDSIVKTDVIYVIKNENIIGKIGEVSIDLVNYYNTYHNEQL